jgi:predicted DNA binding CopG/RHH family protein
MAKKYDPSKVKLSPYEQSIDDAVDYNKMSKPTAAEQEEIKAAAAETLRELKSARANIRMNESDMKALRILADKAGIPYQTLISHVLHLYVTDQLINVQEVKKMVETGVFSRKIS